MTFTIHAIKNNKVIHKADHNEKETGVSLHNAKAIIHAITECDTITVLRSTGAFVSQETMKAFK